MDATAIITAIIGLCTALGLPAILRALADARSKSAAAELTRAEARKTEAEAKKLEAEAARTAAEQTGRLLVGAEADGATVRQALSDMRARLDRCEKRHEDCEERVEAVQRKCDDEHAIKDTQLKALWRELGDVRASMNGGAG